MICFCGPWFIVWVHNIIARMVAYLCYPLFAYVSNLTIIITQNPPHVSLSLAIWLLATSRVHDTGFSPLAHKDFLVLQLVECLPGPRFLGAIGSKPLD